MSEKGKKGTTTTRETMQKRRATIGSMPYDQSFTSPAARSLPVHDPEFHARWPFFSPPPSVKFWSSGRRVCASVDDRENLSQAKRQKPVTRDAEPECISSVFLLNDSSSELACSGSSMCLTEMVNIRAEKDVGVEVESPASVTVSKYQVKPSLKPILDRIYHKHGDIAANFVMLTPESRSLVLDEVCEIIQLFEVKTFKGLIQRELQRVVDRVRDLGRAGLEIGWLLERLEDILEAYQLLEQAPALKEERDLNREAVENKKSERQELEQKLILVDQELQAAEAKLRRTTENVLKVKEKVKSYLRSPLLDKLL